MNTDFDILIAGGGMVGASLACALGPSGLRIGVVEAVPLSFPDQPSYDDRTVALAYGSSRILQGMKVWNQVIAGGVTPIERIHISDRGHFGFTRLEAGEAGIEALGYVTPNRVLGAVLHQTLQTYPQVQFFCPARTDDVHFDPESVRMVIDSMGTKQELTARLVVAADGAGSFVRTAVGIRTRREDYEQSAIVTSVTVEYPHRNTAYERFTVHGPIALLPSPGDRVVVVWSVSRAQAESVGSWSDSEFLDALQQQFGERLGIFRQVGKRHAYPLFLTRVSEHVRPRLTLIGNAAHTVHPVAGQGFNLGLRDVAALAEIIVDATAAGQDIGALSVLQNYASWRVRDNRAVTRFTDSLVRIFSNEAVPFVMARNMGLIAVDLWPGAKRQLVRLTSGLAGRLPRLACGRPLYGKESILCR